MLSLKFSKFSGKNFAQLQATHKDSQFNHLLTAFDFTPDNYKRIHQILSQYPEDRKASSIKELLFLAQDQVGGWIPLTAMKKISKIVGVNEIQVFEVASFYTMFHLQPTAKYNLEVCTTTPCMVKGAKDILKSIQEETGVRVGETSAEGLFSVVETECLGACTNAPVMQINGRNLYEDLTTENVKTVLRKYKAGEEVQPGPQTKRVNSEGPMGRTTLTSKIEKPPCRDFNTL